MHKLAFGRQILDPTLCFAEYQLETGRSQGKRNNQKEGL